MPVGSDPLAVAVESRSHLAYVGQEGGRCAHGPKVTTAFSINNGQAHLAVIGGYVLATDGSDVEDLNPKNLQLAGGLPGTGDMTYSSLAVDPSTGTIFVLQTGLGLANLLIAR